MSMNPPSEVQLALDRAIDEARKKGSRFQISSLFESLPPLEGWFLHL